MHRSGSAAPDRDIYGLNPAQAWPVGHLRRPCCIHQLSVVLVYQAKPGAAMGPVHYLFLSVKQNILLPAARTPGYFLSRFLKGQFHKIPATHQDHEMIRKQGLSNPGFALKTQIIFSSPAYVFDPDVCPRPRCRLLPLPVIHPGANAPCSPD